MGAESWLVHLARLLGLSFLMPHINAPLVEIFLKLSMKTVQVHLIIGTTFIVYSVRRDDG